MTRIEKYLTLLPEARKGFTKKHMKKINIQLTAEELQAITKHLDINLTWAEHGTFGNGTTIEYTKDFTEAKKALKKLQKAQLQ